MRRFTFLGRPLLYCVGAKAEQIIKTRRKQRCSGAAMSRRGGTG